MKLETCKFCNTEIEVGSTTPFEKDPLTKSFSIYHSTEVCRNKLFYQLTNKNIPENKRKIIQISGSLALDNQGQVWQLIYGMNDLVWRKIKELPEEKSLLQMPNPGPVCI